MSVHEHGHQLGDHLYLHRHTPVHGLPAHVKLLTAFAFVVVVVATPVGAWWPFAGYAALVVAVLLWSRLPIRKVAPRLLLELPFVGFAVLMPFVADGPKVEFVGLQLSELGLAAGATFIAKSTLGVSVAVLISATTTAGEILKALAVLRVPNQLVQIASFMVRYSSVVTDELRRMQVAWQARGFTATGIRSWPTVARTAGALFIRSYERGERVHLAMMARGYRGEVDFGAATAATAANWLGAAALPLTALSLLLLWRFL